MTTLLPILTVAFLTVALAAQQTPGQAPQGELPELPDLTNLSLEQLMAVPVEVAARGQETMSTSAASVFVLTAAEIRRSGMRSVPDLLRLVPGLLIAQDVPGAFGFSSRLGEYSFPGMLVLLDGERLYLTLLRREYWQAIDLPIENIERIEVVRGPGGARWGDKATQGVINIVTKKSQDVQGLHGVVLAGTEERGTTSWRYGGGLGAETNYYVYGKMAERDGGYPNTTGDRWGADRVGVRLDTRPGEAFELRADGEYHRSELVDSYVFDPGFVSRNQIEGGHLKGRLRWTHSADSYTDLRLAGEGYDQDIRDTDDGAFYDHLVYREQLFAATVQHSSLIAPGHRLSCGLGWRHLDVDYVYRSDNTQDRYNEIRTDAFVSWDWDLPGDLRLTLGGNVGQFDGKNKKGTDVQPDIRLAWLPTRDLTVWLGASGSREPDRKIPRGGTIVTRKSADLIAYELGVRRRFGDLLLVDATLFDYEISDQESDSFLDPGSGVRLYRHDGRTSAFGGELAVTWNPVRQVRITGFAATTQAHLDNFAADYTSLEREIPRTRLGFTCGWEPVRGIEIDSNVLYVERHYDVPTWWRVDLRLAWRCTEHTTVELVGQNLTDPHHIEYWYQEQAQRGGYLMVSHRF
ncbi:MAG: TonB-dependent receptor [Planctomycetes bacterium]|nr:TonB-dependent receptor [Planctomycetota bacterium]